MNLRTRLQRLERLQPPKPEDPEAVKKHLLARLQDIRARFVASDLPLPPRSEMSIAEKMATATTAKEWEEAVQETRQGLARYRSEE